MAIFFGCDPEFFLKDKTGKFISAIGLVGGSKEEPKAIGNGCFVQEDNVAVEFNIPPVNLYHGSIKDCVHTIQSNFQYVFNYINKTFSKYSKHMRNKWWGKILVRSYIYIAMDCEWI